jgi:RNA-binding protein NOB1
VIVEIRDPDARARVETLYLPFVTQRAPAPASVAVLAEFARKTGDRAVLSKTDIEVLALAYEVECERNGGDWRLRSVPGQRGVNGRPPVKEGEKEGGEVDKIAEGLKDTTLENGEGEREAKETGAGDEKAGADAGTGADPPAQQPQDEDDGSDSDGGWITPSNMKKRQVRDEAVSMASAPETKTMQVACITTDFAVSRSLCLCMHEANGSVPKRPPPNESQSPVHFHHAAHPTPQVVYQALPRLLLHHQGHEQAVLPALRE